MKSKPRKIKAREPKLKRTRNTVGKRIQAGTVTDGIQAALYGREQIDTPERQWAATWAAIRRQSADPKADQKSVSANWTDERKRFGLACALAALRGDDKFFTKLGKAFAWYRRDFKSPSADPARASFIARVAAVESLGHSLPTVETLTEEICRALPEHLGPSQRTVERWIAQHKASKRTDK
jgi:hypothetical protein